MKTLTFQVPDEAYEACQQMAAKYGNTVEECVLEFLLKYGPKPRPRLVEEERQAARERLLRFAGAVNSGDQRSADNDRIDEDLASEYSRTLEKER